ncbi:hypothetical protein PRJ_5496 (plasmid) [Pseudomonas sp. XWY-1]|nr:hypothetical protein PRJ_5496 [Pseudomonas sp. XWY-1]
MIAGNQQTAYLNSPDWPAVAISNLVPGTSSCADLDVLG